MSNEILVTMEAVNELTNTELKKEVVNYLTAGKSIANSRWIMATAIYNIVKSELFDEDFDTDTQFYEFINIKKSNASQLVNATDFMIREGLDFNLYSVGKAYALSTLSIDEYIDFMIYVNERDISISSMSDKALINLIKEWKASQIEDVVEEQEEEEEQEQEQEQEQEIDKEGVIIQMVQTMKELGITIEELTEVYNR